MDCDGEKRRDSKREKQELERRGTREADRELTGISVDLGEDDGEGEHEDHHYRRQQDAHFQTNPRSINSVCIPLLFTM